jgi:lipoate-protein ligase A
VTPYRSVRRRSTAGDFHALVLPEPARPEVWIHDITRPALVLGSTQDDQIVDVAACERLGVDIVRRRSGGGAVLLDPGAVVWVDVILPAGAPGWADDVHAPMVWLGEHLAAAFESAGLAGAVVHRGGLVSTEWSRLVCFDGVGPGELTVGDAKLVGISQRRTRSAARLQACWYTAYDATRLPTLLRPLIDAAALRRVATVPEPVAGGVAEHLVAGLNARL